MKISEKIRKHAGGQGVAEKEALLNRRIDGRRVRQIGVFTGSALILLIAWLTIHWIGVATIGHCLAVSAVGWPSC